MAGTKLDEAAIFNAARRIEDPAERRRYVGEACGEDRALASRVEALLRVHDEGPTFLPCPAEEVRDLLGASGSEGPGTHVGPYKLLRPIGEGGMGTVFLAEQSEPLQRQVAIKVIRPGRDSRQVLARFEQERQALALMDHPHIAKVLDAGEACPPYPGASPRPYFVMELISGVPITEHCDAARLSVRQRLELFVPVCRAVQHAHQKGIIHRDLKPSNVLVTRYDGEPVPKVIDFGIAKATGQKLTERDLETQVGSVVGTLDYMSPEQAVPGQPDIDTRSDIYSLGVLLYELLTGTTPLGPARLGGAALLDPLRAVREIDPPRPSTRLDTTEELPVIAANRGVEPKKLRALVQGDLDWIVMKCLEKNRDRRYESASALALDVEHYLNDAPVAACPPSRGYRLRKFVRRNRGAVLAASTIGLLLVLGIIGTTTGLVRAERARQDAETSQRDEGKQRRLAETRDAETRAVLGFVEQHVIGTARPTSRGGLGPDVTVQRAVEQALPFIDSSFKDQPLIEARLRMTMGHAFYNLGKRQIAAEQFAAARTIYTAEQGPDGPDTLRSVMGLSDSYEMLGRHKDALALRRDVLGRRRAVLGPDHPDTLGTMMSVANSLRDVGELEESVKLHEETLALRRAKLGAKGPETLRSMNNLATSLEHAGRRKEALALRKETLALRREVLGDKHTDTLLSMMALANSDYRFGRFAEAAKLYEETLREQESQLSREHPDTVRTIQNLANCYAALGQQKKALTLRQEALDVCKRKLGIDHPSTLNAMMNLALSLDDLGRHKDAMQLLEETLRRRRDKLGRDHPDTLLTMQNLADCYNKVGRDEDALTLQRQTLAMKQAKLGISHPDTLRTMWGQAISLLHLDRGAEAVQVIDECLRLAAGKELAPGMLPQMINARLRHFAKSKDGAGCRASAEMWEKFDRRDADSLYNAACWRAITAQVLRDAGASGADAEADRAIAWLRQAVAAGYRDAGTAASDHDLDALRGRADFRELLGQLQARSSSDPK